MKIKCGGAIKVSVLFTVFSLVLMICYCNMITVVLFNLFKTISFNLTTWTNSKNQSNVSNIDKIKKAYKTEYWICNEIFLFIGRTIGQCLFIIMGLNTNYLGIFMVIFIVFYILYEINSIKLQNVIMEEPIK